VSGRARHSCVIAIFIFFGIAALVPTVFYMQRTIGASADYQNHDALYKYILRSPGILLAPAMAIAGLLTWKLGLLARGMHSSVARIVGGTVLACFAYPLVYYFVVFATFASGSLLLSLAGSTGYARTSPGPHPELGVLLALPLPAMLYLGGALTISYAAIVFGIVTQSWPRRVARWAFTGPAGTILCIICVAAIVEKIRFPTLSSWRIIENSASEFFWGPAWNVPPAFIIGAPFIAALLGHWLYLAAEEYSKAAA